MIRTFVVMAALALASPALGQQTVVMGQMPNGTTAKVQLDAQKRLLMSVGIGGGASSTTATGTCTAVTTSATLLAANANRRGALITAMDTNTVRARYAFATSATTTQMPLLAGASLSIDGRDWTGPISFISDDGATSITICVLEW